MHIIKLLTFLVISSISLFGDGLLSKYYSNPTFDGNVTSDVNATIDFSWGINAGPDSATWSGYIHMPMNGDYTFWFAHDNDFNISIDDNPIYSSTTSTGSDTSFISNTTTFSAGYHFIKINYIKSSNTADANYAKLHYTFDDVSIANKAVVPDTSLFSYQNIVRFSQTIYNVAEDINPTSITKVLEINLTLDYNSSIDVSIDFNTVAGTAIENNDYIAANGTTTFKAGETSKYIYLLIYNDESIELEENFYLLLSNLTPDDGTVGLANTTAEILIIEQIEAKVCYTDDFSEDLDDWRLLYSNGTFEPAIVNNRLRMTTADGNIATAVTKDYKFLAANNLIIIEFDHYSYDGSGADGFTIVLYDSDIGDSPVPGAFGGSLGYANRDGVDGFEGGWLGVGLDEWGNFSNPTEGRDGGTGFIKNNITIRGQGVGETGYTYLASTGTLDPVLWKSDINYSGGRFKITIDSRDSTKQNISVQRDSDLDGNYEEVIINQFDAQASQGEPPVYLRLAITASTGGSNAIHELDNLEVNGVCSQYITDNNETNASNADVVDYFGGMTMYDNGWRYITTKKTADTTSLTAVHLNNSGSAEAFTTTDNNYLFTTFLYLSDSNCSTQEILYTLDGQPAKAIMSNGQISSTIDDIVLPSSARKDARIRVTTVDVEQLIADNGATCAASNLSANIPGIPQCANSAGQYLSIFGQDAFDRCIKDDGSGPCDDGAATTEFPGDYACLMCTANVNPSCSSDTFSIRPDNFEVLSPDTHYPDLLLAGLSYNFSVKAYDYGLTAGSDTTDDYNIINADTHFIMSSVNMLKTGDEDTSGELEGSATFTPVTFNMLDGVSTDGTSTEVVGITFDNVGDVVLTVTDSYWAENDINDNNGYNDPTTNACDSGSVCGSVTTRFIPHHFTFVDLNITNNDGTNTGYTYLSNLTDANQASYVMSGRLSATIQAENATGGITTNFKDGTSYYENPLSLTLGVTDGTIGVANTTSITELRMGFGIANGDAGGVKTMPPLETDLTKVLRFNFPRQNDTPINPFVVDTADTLAATISSTYSSNSIPPATIGDVTITDVLATTTASFATGTSKATFLYGRTHAPRQRFVGNSGTVFIYYEAYCEGGGCTKSLLPDNNASTSTDDPRWFKNTQHLNPSSIVGVGTITPKYGANVSVTSIPSNTVPSQATLTYGGTVYPYKTTMKNQASPWLIYNKYNAGLTYNEFEVEYDANNNLGWAGKADTTSTTDDTSSKKTNRRTMW